MVNPNELTAESLWSDVSARLKGTLNEKTFRNWFGEVAAVRLDDETFVLAVPNDLTREWIEGRFADLIRAGVTDAAGTERRLELVVEAPAQVITPPVRPPADGAPINPKYTFDSFVIGSSNRFAHAAALAIAEAPAQAYNPLFIYGHTGLGKTHLLHAVANYIGLHSSSLGVRYVTSETFMNDFINSLRDKRIEGFKQRYRAYDVLLIDDVQFFEHKERIQEEFFHTFNSLHEAGRQIVMSSDRPPRDIQTLEDRLRSRFEWGLITDIQPPDLETRIAILRRKVKYDRIEIGDEEVLTHIASRVTTNIRELEGALTRVVAFASLTGRFMDVELAQDVLRDVFPHGEAGGRLDRADPGARLRPLRRHARRADERAALPEHRLPAAGRDVPLTRAHRLLAAEDRQALRRPRPHDGHPRNLENRPSDQGGQVCVQPRPGTHSSRETGSLNHEPCSEARSVHRPVPQPECCLQHGWRLFSR